MIRGGIWSYDKRAEFVWNFLENNKSWLYKYACKWGMEFEELRSDLCLRLLEVSKRFNMQVSKFEHFIRVCCAVYFRHTPYHILKRYREVNFSSLELERDSSNSNDNVDNWFSEYLDMCIIVYRSLENDLIDILDNDELEKIMGVI